MVQKIVTQFRGLVSRAMAGMHSPDQEAGNVLEWGRSIRWLDCVARDLRVHQSGIASSGFDRQGFTVRPSRGN